MTCERSCETISSFQRYTLLLYFYFFSNRKLHTYFVYQQKQLSFSFFFKKKVHLFNKTHYKSTIEEEGWKQQRRFTIDHVVKCCRGAKWMNVSLLRLYGLFCDSIHDNSTCTNSLQLNNIIT